jgi:hypothetical protein
VPTSERRYAADPDDTHRALVQAVRDLYPHDAADDYVRSIRFRARPRFLSRTHSVTAYVVAREGGSMVRVEWAAGGQAASRQIDRLLSDVAKHLTR